MDPFYTVWEMCEREDTRAAKYIKQLLAEDPTDTMQEIRNRVTTNSGTKFIQNIPRHEPYAKSTYDSFGNILRT